MAPRVVPPSERSLRRSLAPLVAPALWARRGARVTTRALRGADDPLPSPPVIAWRLARALGVEAKVARRWLDACVLFYAAADLLDDAEDGDVPPEEAPVARCEALELLFASQVALSRVHPDAARTRRLLRCFAEEGARMARGQGMDLAGTGRLSERDPLEIAREKSGAEFAALLGGAALLAALPAGRWREAGRALGAVFQVYSDYRDAYVEGGEDLARGKPTLALRPLDTPEEVLLAAHAGDLGVPTRAAEARAMLHPGARASLAAVVARAEPLRRRARHPFLRDLAARAASLPVPAAPTAASRRAVVPLAPDRDRALRAAEDFLRADPELAEAAEVHRHGLFGRAEVRADLFGPMFAEALMHEAGVSPSGLAQALLARGAQGGWRYYPGHHQIPPDADDVGVALQLGARAGVSRGVLDEGRGAPTRERRTRRRGADLADLAGAGPRRPRGPVGARRVSGGRGAGRSRLVALVRRGRAGGRAAGAPAPHPRTRGSCGSGLAVVRAGAGRRHRGALPRAPRRRDGGLSPAAPRARRRRRAAARATHPGQRVRDLLETALAARALWSMGALPAPEAVAMTLIDAQDADGGFPADPSYNTVPHHRPRRYGSRVVTTAAALAALRALPAPTPRSPQRAAPGAGPAGPSL